jgi:hypothetical protein
VVNLPLAPERIVTTTAPQSSVSRQDIMSNNNMMARAINDVADATMEIATKQAREQAAEDISQQKVVRNEDGSVSTVNPANSVIFGRAGEVYSEAVKAGTLAQTSNVITEGLGDIHRKHPNDPQGFKTEATAYLDKYRGGQSGCRRERCG